MIKIEFVQTLSFPLSSLSTSGERVTCSSTSRLKKNKQIHYVHTCMGFILYFGLWLYW